MNKLDRMRALMVLGDINVPEDQHPLVWMWEMCGKPEVLVLSTRNTIAGNDDPEIRVADHAGYYKVYLWWMGYHTAWSWSVTKCTRDKVWDAAWAVHEAMRDVCVREQKFPLPSCRMEPERMTYWKTPTVVPDLPSSSFPRAQVL